MAKKAMVVGINKYQGLSTLSCCVNDDQRVKQLLEWNGEEDGSQKTRNFDEVRYPVMQDYGVSRGELEVALASCFDGRFDTALFYFSGHGAIDEHGGGYISATDHQQAISMRDLLDTVNHSACINKIVILDCCYSGACGQSDARVNGSGQNFATLADGVTILTSSHKGQVSYETQNKRYSDFTGLLIEALEGGAANLLGDVTPSGVYANIDTALGLFGQRPMFKTNTSRLTRIRKVPPLIDMNAIRRMGECFPSMEYEMPLDTTYLRDNSVDWNEARLPIEPYAVDANVEKMRQILRKLESNGLVVPCGEHGLYRAAKYGKSCKLTKLGQYYWRLVMEEKIL